MKGDDEFMKLGQAHAAQGLPRYKFQEPHLQKLYDLGYDLESGVLKLVAKRRCRGCGHLLSPSPEYPSDTYCPRCI